MCQSNLWKKKDEDLMPLDESTKQKMTIALQRWRMMQPISNFKRSYQVLGYLFGLSLLYHVTLGMHFIHGIQTIGGKTSQKADSTAALHVQSCTAQDRRALASKGASASPEEWKAMTECILDDHLNNKFGHYFQHVSKTGGTSMCFLFKNNNCQNNNKVNCARSDMGCAWHRHEVAEEVGLPKFCTVSDVNFHDHTCQQITQWATEERDNVIFSERNIPKDGLCGNFVNSIMVREPISRIQSHYSHLQHRCLESDKQQRARCQSLYFNDHQQYEVPRMTEYFDIISDNYYTRSLSPKEVFLWQANATIPSLSARPDAETQLLPKVLATLRSFDWVMLIDSPKGKWKEARQNTAIFQYGLGLFNTPALRQLNSSWREPKNGFSNATQLQQLQSLDYVLWEEAQRLHQLDIYSIKRMKPYYPQALELAKSKRCNVDDNNACCGNTCVNIPSDADIPKENEDISKSHADEAAIQWTQAHANGPANAQGLFPPKDICQLERASYWGSLILSVRRNMVLLGQEVIQRPILRALRVLHIEKYICVPVMDLMRSFGLMKYV